MNWDFDFQFGARIAFGSNAIDRLGALAMEMNGTRALVVTDPGVKKAGYAHRAVDSLRNAGLKAEVFSDVAENPTTMHVEAGTAYARENGSFDLLVGLGGGSAMDCAKGINFLLTNGGRMEDYWGSNRATKPMLPSIGIPTTAGTGSEAQSYALISQQETHRKMACGDKKAMFRAVILDPVLTLTVPPEVAATAGIDAITHAVESYVTTARTPLSQMYSREAWRLLNANYTTVLTNPEDLEARSAMLWGAHLAGIAIENSMLGAAHACANPLTSHYGIAHGAAVGLMLPHVIRFNAKDVAPLYRQLSGIEPDELSQTIDDCLQQAGLPRQLRHCGIKQKLIASLAAEAAEQWTGKFNPKPLAVNDFVNLYEAAF